jgi:hypothetical protein
MEAWISASLQHTDCTASFDMRYSVICENTGNCFWENMFFFSVQGVFSAKVPHFHKNRDEELSNYFISCENGYFYFSCEIKELVLFFVKC